MRRLFVALVIAAVCYALTRWTLGFIALRFSTAYAGKLLYAFELAGLCVSALVATFVCRRPTLIGSFTWLLPMAFALPFVSSLPESRHLSFIGGLGRDAAWFLVHALLASLLGAWLGFVLSGINHQKPNHSSKPKPLRGSAQLRR